MLHYRSINKNELNQLFVCCEGKWNWSWREDPGPGDGHDGGELVEPNHHGEASQPEDWLSAGCNGPASGLGLPRLPAQLGLDCVRRPRLRPGRRCWPHSSDRPTSLRVLFRKHYFGLVYLKVTPGFPSLSVLRTPSVMPYCNSTFHLGKEAPVKSFLSSLGTSFLILERAAWYFSFTFDG